MTKRSTEPVAEGVFDFLDSHMDQYEEEDEDDPIKPPGPLGDFLVTFFQQYFDAVWKCEIKAIDQTSKTQVTRLRLVNKGAGKPTTLLFTAFEDLCDRWPDFLGFQYAGHKSELSKFHQTFLPRLLRRIRDWASVEGFKRLEARAAAALKRLQGEASGGA